MKLTVTLFLFFVSVHALAQTNDDVNMLQQRYQKCLDSGQAMRNCALVFFNQMDSLLNLAYNQLRSNSDSIQKNNLKDDQKDWLMSRDNYFKKTKADLKGKAKTMTQDAEMMMHDKNAAFVKTRVLELIKKQTTDYAAENYKVNPTGFYSLDSKTEKRNGETYGYFGDIKVKLLSKDKVVVNLFVCKGAPSYNMGMLSDTLQMVNNKALFQNKEIVNGCTITFSFYKMGIYVEDKRTDTDVSCIFGFNVFADGFFKRKSSKVPKDKELVSSY
jgi:uncharacterized protein YecT (DUF1311 family)